MIQAFLLLVKADCENVAAEEEQTVKMRSTRGRLHSFKQYLLSIYHVLNTRDTVVDGLRPTCLILPDLDLWISQHLLSHTLPPRSGQL